MVESDFSKRKRATNRDLLSDIRQKRKKGVNMRNFLRLYK